MIIKNVTVLKLSAATLVGAWVLGVPLYAAQASSALSSIQDGAKVIATQSVADKDLTAGAEKFIDSMANRAIGFLGNESLSADAKKKEFRSLLRANFDMKTLGRFALGRYWTTASPAQRDEYQKLFEAMIVDVYSSRFSEYKGQDLEVRSSRMDGEKDVNVTSFVVDKNSGQDIQVDWRVRYKDGSYRVVDVIVEGVSMAVTQRSDFSAVIQRGGGEVAVLIDHLKTN